MKGNKKMQDKELYHKKMQAKLDEWIANIDKLKAKSSGASADMQLKLNKNIDNLKDKVNVGKTKLAELANTSEEAWGPLKEGIESAWTSLNATFKETMSKFK